MNNQKDTQKTSLNSYGQSNVLDVKTLTNKPALSETSRGRHIYEFANKKTEKLVTALYMVTDCMDVDDALKSKLRQLGVELLSDMYKLSTLSPVDKHAHISSSLARVDEILSFIEIAYTIGFISEMNTLILKKEFIVLIGELENHQKKDRHFAFTLNEQMFSLPEKEESQLNFSNHLNGGNILKDKSRDYADKRTNINGMSFMNNKLNSSSHHVPTSNGHVVSIADKKERVDKILALVKDRDVGIKDISNSFTDCSEKTIQRELNALVLKGQIKKTGSKRWSRYQLVVSK